MMAAFLGMEGAIVVLLGGVVRGQRNRPALDQMEGRGCLTFELPFGSFLGAAGLLVALVAMLRPAAQ